MNLASKGVIKGRGYVLGDAPFVAVIGGANIDIHGKSNNTLRASDSNPGVVHTSAGGVARNIAENMARLGIDCRLISAIGRDHNGQMLMRLCRDAGIDMQYVHEIESVPTSTYLSVLDDKGDMRVAIADMSIIDELGAARLQPQQAMLAHASLLILDANLVDDAIAWLTGTFADKVIFADTVSTTKAPRLRPYLASIHTLKTSTIEVEALTGCQARTQAQLREVAGALHAEGVERVFITRGAAGVFYSANDTRGAAVVFYSANDTHGNKKLKGPTREVLNAGGSGDAFLAGLAYAWLTDLPLDKTLSFALAAADITVSHPATINPALTLAAVNRAMEAQHAC